MNATTLHLSLVNIGSGNGLLSSGNKPLPERRPSLLTLYYSFAYPYLIYGKQVGGNNDPTAFNKLLFVQKRLVRIITCYPFRAHTESLMYARKILSVISINTYLKGISMHRCIHREVPEIFLDLFEINDDIHDHNTRHSQQLHVPYGKLDVRRFSFKVHGANVWNSIPDHIKNAQNIHIFKQLFRIYLIESNWFCAIATGWYTDL